MKILRCLTCIPLLLLSLCGCSEAKEKIKESPKADNEPIRIACIGDSLTQGIGATGWQDGDYRYAYPQQLGEILGSEYEVGNFGKGSSYVYYYEGRTEDLWYPNTAAYSNGNKFEPDIVLLMLGTNDARVMNNQADAAEFKKQYTDLVEHYLDMESKPEVYIVSAITMVRYDAQMREPNLKKYILPVQQEVAQEYNLKYIDTYNELYELYASGEGLASDDLHPNNTGYRALAELVAKNLDLE